MLLPILKETLLSELILQFVIQQNIDIYNYTLKKFLLNHNLCNYYCESTLICGYLFS